MRGHSFAILVVLLALQAAAGYDLDGIPGKHLIVSTPSTGMVWWSNNTQDITDPGDVELVLDYRGNPMVPQLTMHMLISPETVSYPMGLALERMKGTDKSGYEVIKRFLFVADPGENCELMHVLRFPFFESGGVFSVGSPQIVMENKCVRWVAVDVLGNMYASCEETGEILKVPVGQIRKNLIKPPPIVLYSSAGPSGMQVTSPGGITVDSFHTYWSNKVMGGSTGSVVKASSFRPAGKKGMPSVVPLAKNADLGKDYGVCLVGQNVFFTEKTKRLYAVGKNGGAIAVVTDQLQEPRGCDWDRDGSVYVADRKAGQIWSFPALQKTLRTVGKLKRIATIEDAFAVIVVDSAILPSKILPLALALGSALLMATP